MLRPVHRRPNVVANVVAIIPALFVILHIDAGNAVFVGITGIFTVDKRMLCPVANHGNKTIDEKGKTKQPTRLQASLQNRERYKLPQRPARPSVARVASLGRFFCRR